MSRTRTGTKARLPLGGHMALDPADLADARRRRPAVELGEYANRRELEFLGSQNARGHFGALPLDEDLQFNVIRGVLPGGRFGIVFHEVMAWPVGADGSPVTNITCYGLSYSDFKVRGPRDVLALLPVVGTLIDPPLRVRDAVGVPCTVAGFQVPEAGVLRTTHRITNEPQPSITAEDKQKLHGHGLVGWTLLSGTQPNLQVVDRLLKGPFRSALSRLGHPRFVEVRIHCAMVVVRRNGFVIDPSALDDFASAAAAIADAVRDACLPEARPQPFERPLRPPAWPREGWRIGADEPPPSIRDALEQLAERTGMSLEDPVAFHQAFPSLPVPGSAYGIMQGPVPGAGVSGRLAFYVERRFWSYESGRTAVIMPAAPHAPDTPPGGVAAGAGGLLTARHGLVCFTKLRREPDVRRMGDEALALIEEAVAVTRHLLPGGESPG